MTHSRLLKPVAVAALLALSAGAQATIAVYTTQASFLAAIGAYGVDTFDDLTPGAATGPGPLSRSAGGISYEVATSPNSPIMYGAGSPADPWLSTNNAADFITFSGFSPGVYAAGAQMFGSDVAGAYLERGLLAVRASNGVDTETRFKFRAPQDTFFGFVSDSPLTTLEIKMFYGSANPVWPAVNDLILAAVPEPETYALMLAGLAAIGFMARRRRS